MGGDVLTLGLRVVAAANPHGLMSRPTLDLAGRQRSVGVAVFPVRDSIHPVSLNGSH
jgi:hypothetical protein